MLHKVSQRIKFNKLLNRKYTPEKIFCYAIHMKKRRSISSQLIKLVFASLLAAMMTVVVGIFVYQIIYNTSQDGGWAGLGASIGTTYFVFVAYPIFELFALWKFKIANWLYIGIVFSASVMSIYYIQDTLGPTNSTLSLGEYYTVEIGIVTVLLITLWLILNQLSTNIIIRCVLSVLIGMTAVVGIISFATAQNNAYNELSNNTAINSINFPIYLPKVLPAGTKITSIQLPIASGTDLFDSVPYLHLYFSGSMYDMYESKVGNSYNPPQNCGMYIPGFNYGAGSCQKVTSVNSIIVYYVPQHSYPPENEYYFKKGDTIFTFTSVNHTFTDKEMAELINSLVLLNPADIQRLNDSLR